MAITVNGFSVILADRVRETTQTTGTGSYSVDGAASGARTFVAGVGNGNRTTYTVAMGANWETAIGTVTSGAPSTVSRDSILASSNSGNAVNWGVGVKDIFVDATAAVIDGLQTNLDAIKTQHFGRFDASTLPRDVVIPAAARWIDVGFSNLVFSGTGSIHAQLGTGGVADATGYLSQSGSFNGVAHAVLQSTTSFVVWLGDANSQAFGNMRLLHIGSNLWTESHGAALASSPTAVMTGGGAKQMSGAVELLRVAAVGGQTPDGWLGITVGF